MINYTVKAGDTLGTIARQFYGDSRRYMEIALYNQLADPNRIYIGQRLQIPGTEELQEIAVTARKVPEVSITNAATDPLPGTYALEAIEGSAPRDYLPALIALGIVGYVLMDKRRI